MPTSRSRRPLLALATALLSGAMAATGSSAVLAAPLPVPLPPRTPARQVPPTTPTTTTTTTTTGTPPSHHAAPVTAEPPVRIAVVGDSVAWGQGLADPHRFSSLVRQALATRTGRTVDVDVYAHSGAVLTGACAPTPGGAAVPGELPFGAPSVACQLVTAAASGHAYDLVLLSGCINDLTATFVLLGRPSVGGAVARRCTAPLAAAVTAARRLPGAPKVVVTGYYPIVSRRTPLPAFTLALRTAFGAAADTDATAARRLAIRRSAQFSTAFDQVARAAVAKQRGSAVFVSPGFGASDALFAPATKLWTGLDDDVHAARATACAAVPGITDVDRERCAVASVGHPNVAGAARYASRIGTAIARWFPAAH